MARPRPWSCSCRAPGLRAAAVYRTETLGVDGGEPGPWFSLKIRDADWTYTPEGPEPRERTLNHFIDADHIHFEVQKKDGDGWTTTLSGDETRVK